MLRLPGNFVAALPRLPDSCSTCSTCNQLTHPCMFTSAHDISSVTASDILQDPRHMSDSSSVVLPIMLIA